MIDLEEFLNRRKSDDYDKVKATFRELCNNGVGKGCYQDYSVLVDIMELISYIENRVKENK